MAPAYLFDHNWCAPGILDEQEGVLKFKQFLPNGMKTYRAALRKASCIVGWTTAFLGLVRIVPDEDEKEAWYMGKRQDKKLG